MVYVPTANNQGVAHTYGVNWTSAALTWLVDGVAVRTLLYEDAKGGTRFPQTPMKLKVGAWAGGDADNNAQGTVEWAMGGKPGSTNYADGPFSMYVESINIINYSPAAAYSYSDNTGNWQSIRVEEGEVGGIVSPEDAAADLATKSSASFTATTGSGVPVKPLETGSNSTATGVFVTTTRDGRTVVSAETGAAATSSSGVAESNSASTVGINVFGCAVLALLMTVLA
jgi:beta-glucanase (GH16 family)